MTFCQLRKKFLTVLRIILEKFTDIIIRNNISWGVWLVQSVERMILDLRLVISSPMLGAQIT